MLIAFAGSALAAAGARAIVPTDRLADEVGELDLEAAIPSSFGQWRLEPEQARSVVNPQQEQVIKTIYSQVLSRSYKAQDGYRIMLSIAYGREQLDDLRAHFPEVCYAVNGFKVGGEQVTTINAAGGSIPVRRLETSLGASRMEPVTYWMMIGDQPHLGGYHAKIAEMRYMLRGVIPDGLLFRVSSIDDDSQRAFARQDQFIADLLAAVSPAPRRRLAGY
jgi:EpsI family protein